MTAFVRNVLTLIKKNLAISIIGGLFLFAFAAGVYRQFVPLTPGEVRAEQQAELASAEASSAAQQRQSVATESAKYICHLKSVCENFAQARQDCAMAGNFDNCIKVKLGDENAALVDVCTNDGKLLYPPDQMPDFLSCFIWNHRRT